MLRGVADLHGCTICASDGDIGRVGQVYFDDKAWGIRYLVVDTGDWLRDRQVLVSPYSVERVDAATNQVHVRLTRQQVRDSPSIDSHKPVSRQRETEYLRYYRYPTYWGGPNLWGMGAYPAFDPASVVQQQEALEPRLPPLADSDRPLDIHLCDTSVVKGYHLETVDGKIGHVSGFVYDDEAWAIRYLTIDTRNWWPVRKEVLIATHWVDLIDEFASTVSTSLTLDAVKHSPPYDDSVAIERSYELALHAFYGKEGYWAHGRSALPPDRN